MTEETQQLLENLRLKKMATILDQELENAKNNSPSYSEFLLRLLQAQWHERQEKCLQYRIRQARLPEQWTLESFPFKNQPGVSRRQIQELAELEFIPKALPARLDSRRGLLLKALQNGSSENPPQRKPARPELSNEHVFNSLVAVVAMTSAWLAATQVGPSPNGSWPSVGASYQTPNHALCFVTCASHSSSSWRAASSACAGFFPFS